MNAWIIQNIRERGWSQRELARRSGYSHSMVSDVLSEKVPPSFDFCAAIAKAFGERPEIAFQLAGLLSAPPSTSDEPTAREVWETVSDMSPEKREEALGYIRYLYQQDKEERRRLKERRQRKQQGNRGGLATEGGT